MTPPQNPPRDGGPALAQVRYEDERYAATLRGGVWVAMMLLVATLAAYLLGGVPARVAPAEAPFFWNLSAAEYARATGTPAGWAALDHLGEAEALTLLPALLLASLSAWCYMHLLPHFIRSKDWAFAVIILLQLAVFLLAAWPH